MDPIHPLVPHAPTMPPVVPSPRTTAAERDGGRSGAEGQAEKRRRGARQPDAAAEPDQAGADAPGTPVQTPDDGHPHIDITV